MKTAIRLFLILLTLVVILFAWMTHQFGNQQIQILIIVLVATSLALFLILNLLEQRELRKKRKRQESGPVKKSGPADPDVKRSGNSFALRERKAGLTWGGGNIKASEATRGTKRKFLGK